MNWVVDGLREWSTVTGHSLVAISEAQDFGSCWAVLRLAIPNLARRDFDSLEGRTSEV